MRTIVLFSVLLGVAHGFAYHNSVSSLNQRRHGINRLRATDKSESVPFLPSAKNLRSDMPGYAGFDPLGFTDNWLDKDWSQQIVPDIWPATDGITRKPVTTVEWMQEAEIKHGRVAMLAVVGWLVVDSGVRLPGTVFSTIKTSLSAHDAAVANGSMGFLLLLCFILELAGGAAIYDQAKGSGRMPGDFSFDPLGLGKIPMMRKTYATNEIKNGRLAMLAISGLITQSALFPDLSFPYF